MMKITLLVISCATLLAIAHSWPLAPQIAGYHVYNGFHPYVVPFRARLHGHNNVHYRGGATMPVYNKGHRARPRRQLGMGAGMGGSSAQAQAQSSSMGMGGGMGGFGMGYPGFMGMGLPFGFLG